ncbi:MAG: hypothetical protein H6735_13705 [Alphaproteobacteria bacterium]|nr:hypothetical protein [Alphaproteobacteria bacterium]
MSIPDPFASFSGGFLHKADIASAEAFTGVRGRSWSRHAAEPAVRAGADPEDAVAAVHWAGIGLGAAGAIWWLTRK